MRKRNRLSMLGAGFALALAGLTGTVQATAPMANSQQELKATGAKHTEREARKVHSAGGLDLMQQGEYGMSPKEYGLRYGNGASRKHKSNKLQRSHMYKVGKRAK